MWDGIKKIKQFCFLFAISQISPNENGKPNYQLQIPFKSALVTVTANVLGDDAMLSFANNISLKKIAALIQSREDFKEKRKYWWEPHFFSHKKILLKATQ